MLYNKFFKQGVIILMVKMLLKLMKMIEIMLIVVVVIIKGILARSFRPMNMRGRSKIIVITWIFYFPFGYLLS